MAAFEQIPSLPAGIGLNGTEQFWAVQQGSDVRLTANQIGTYIQSHFPPLTNAIEIGLTNIVSGTSGHVLYDNAGIVGEMTTSGSGTQLALTNSPVFTTPNLGTPSAVTLTNGTGLPISSGVSGLGTGVATLLGGTSSGTGGPAGTISPIFTGTVGAAAITATGIVTTSALKTSTALITTTGASTPAFGTNFIGGAGGPTTAAQNGWLVAQDSTGATIWIPVWK